MLNKFDVNNDGIVNIIDATTIINEINESKNDVKLNPLYPEYYGAKGDGLNLYDWPLRCFNGIITVKKEETTNIDVNIFAPSERIKLWFNNLPELITTDNVYFNKTTNHFVLFYNNKYYNLWNKTKFVKPLEPKMDMNGLNEDNIWDDCSGGVSEYMINNVPREDVVFNDLTTRKSYIWKEDELVDIDTLMTNDYAAIMNCLKTNKGNMLLRPNTCYYMKISKQLGDTATNPLFGCDGFEINGNGSTIFARRTDAGTVPTSTGGVQKIDVFRFSNSKNGKIKNLRIKALRDRDNGAPSGHKRFSTSDSALVAFSIVSNKDKGKWSCNLTFDGIDCKGMYEDFDIRSGSDFTIKNWKSREVCQNFGSCKNVLIINADIVQHPFCGSGMHLNYFGIKNCWAFNSRYRQGGPFTSVMLTHHASSTADDIHYINCIIEGNKVVQGTYMQHQYFDYCIFKQIWKGIFTDDNFSISPALIVGTKINLTFTSCRFEIDSEKLISTAKENTLTLAFNNCGIHAKNVDDMTMITGFTGILNSTNNIINWSGTLGLEI